MSRILYQGRKVTKNWHTRHVLKRTARPVPQASRPRKRPEPILARILLPAVASLRDDQPIEYLIDLALPLHRWDVEMWRDDYLAPPCTELPTFFPDMPNTTVSNTGVSTKT